MSNASERGYYEFEDKIQFTCNLGYRLIGEDIITCMNNGQWNHPAPICQSTRSHKYNQQRVFVKPVARKFLLLIKKQVEAAFQASL